MRTGVLGGTFDPPHLGHLRLAEAARAQLHLDHVLFMTAGVPYRKASRAVSPPEVRLRLVEAAIAGLPWAEASTLELQRSGPTYTDQTLEELARDGGDWWLIAGTDVLVDLPHWRDPRRIIRHARLAIAVRPPAERTVPEATARAVPGVLDCIDWIEMKALDISSTELRRRVAAGEATNEWLPEPVRVLIDELGLYRD
jgi:nicotinate-nucleotide adenylyltransferase